MSFNSCTDTYHLVELLNDRLSVQIPFNAPPNITTTNISLYINLRNIDDFTRSYDEDTTIVAHLSVLSSYSGVDPPADNTILPVVTLTGLNGLEETTAVIPISRKSPLDQCYDSLQNLNHTYINVQVNVHSPPMYTQLGEYDFIISLFLYSPESSALNSSLSSEPQPDGYTVTVSIISLGKPSTVFYSLNATTHVF